MYYNQQNRCPKCGYTSNGYQVYRSYPNPQWNTPGFPPYYQASYSEQYAPYSDGGINNTANVYQQNQNHDFQDYGPEPFVVNIEEVTLQNPYFRTALWTGEHLQLTLMSIPVGEEIGLEIHPELDQFIRIEEGDGLVQMGDQEDQLDFEETVTDDYVFIIPAGKYHNLINIGDIPLKLYSIYAPPEHPHGTIHETKEDALAAEEHDF